MKKLISWLLIMLLGVAFYLWQPDFVHQAYYIIKHGDIAALADYLRSFGHWTIVAIIVLFVIMTFTIVFPFILGYNYLLDGRGRGRINNVRFCPLLFS